MAEPQTRTADKKPEKYVGADGKTHIRMVPVRKDIVKTESQEVDEISLDAIKKSVTAKNLSKSVNKATNKDKIKMDLATLRKKLATEAYSMKEMCCKNCGDMYGKPTEGNCMYDAYDKNGKNWVTKKEYLAAQKKNEEVELDEAQIISKKPHPDGGHIVKLKTDGGQTVTRHLKNGKVKTLKVHKEEVEEAVGTSAKYAGKSGMFGGKYTSKDRMMDLPLAKLNKVRDKRQAQNKAAHDKQDPKMSKMGYAKHMLDVDKADAKARKRGIDPTGKYDRYKKKNNIKDSVQVDEVLDRPGALDSYRKKADASGNKARNSATRKILQGPDKDGKRADHSDELKTMRKRNKGQDMADRVAAKQFRKSIGRGYNAPKEEGYASDAQRKAVWAAKNDKKQQNESFDLTEKLNVGDGMGSWIKDFQASDAPQFAGKSDKEKRNMAIAAYLSKKRGN